MGGKKKTDNPNTIASNRKARHDYAIEAQYEAGLALEGWEVKALRAGRAQLKESYVVVTNNELWLLNTHITPLSSTSTHIKADPTRSRKLLLTRKEIDKLIGLKERAGYTLVPLSLYWKKNRIKATIALAKGKKAHDKRDSIKEREWNRAQQRLMRTKR